jgi:hypothetical protein
MNHYRNLQNYSLHILQGSALLQMSFITTADILSLNFNVRVFNDQFMVLCML